MKIEKITGVESYNGKQLPSNFRKYLESFSLETGNLIMEVIQALNTEFSKPVLLCFLT